MKCTELLKMGVAVNNKFVIFAECGFKKRKLVNGLDNDTKVSDKQNLLLTLCPSYIFDLYIAINIHS